MIYIEKKYHFYAGHRNEKLDDKCRNIHGHTYRVTLTLEFNENTKKDGVTLLFSDIDKKMAPLIESLDHSFLMNESDPLYDYLVQYENRTNDNLKINVFPFETSAENLAQYLYDEIKHELELPIAIIELQETDTSTVIYGTK